MCISKTVKICSNQHTDILGFIFTGFFENLKSFIYIFDKRFSFAMLHELAKFNYQSVFTSQVIQ